MKTLHFRRMLREVLRTAKNLPTIPEILAIMQKALQDENVSTDSIANLISNDPSIASNILRLANSAYYSSSGTQISTVADAVIRIGLKDIGRLVSVMAAIQSFNVAGQRKDHNLFWKHSICVANASKYLSTRLPHVFGVKEDEAYLTGLLHDIGMLVIDQFFPEISKEIWNEASSGQVLLEEIEMAKLKMDHGEVGGKFLDKWKLPERIVTAVSRHHQSGTVSGRDRGLVLCIYISNQVCNRNGFHGWSGKISTDIPAEIMEELGLESDTIEGMIAHIQKAAEQSEVVISLANGASSPARG
ncbi:MAG: HDOD domain-containing protein [Candidatus Krumholzibacteriota bacterium]|nr:HDOD domain-containing protein [Candidatus Krumholzibacteriota bacterium]